MTDLVNLKDILNNISVEYNIPIDELMKYSKNKKTKKKCCLCRARKQDGQQCTRKSKPNSIFCGKHLDKRNYGCISDEPYIDCRVIRNNDKVYYIDDYNIVYESLGANKYKIIGKKRDNNIEFLSQ